MGLPSISINFKTQGATAIARSQKGTVAMILKDASAAGAHEMASAAEIPEGLSKANKDYVARAFLGYVDPPKKVLLYVLAADAADLTDGLGYFATQVFDYLVGPPEITAEEATAVASWVKSRRAEGFTPKAVLPNCTADSEAVINFTTGGIKVGDDTFTAAQYCSRIAGLIAGTPMTISCTYAPLPEVSDITRMSKSDMDDAIDAGKFILMHDGKKVKVGRGINSLTTTTQEKGETFKKIKVVEAVDMMLSDIQATAQDSYIGKYANSYDNKCLLATAIQGYLEQLELDGVLKRGESSVTVDLIAQEAYLKSSGVDTSAMSEQEIKEADTRDKVFLTAVIKILDAIEEINLDITI